MKKVSKRIIGNLKILGIALVLAFMIFIVIKRPDLLKASVLLLEDRQTIETNKRDIGYQNTGNFLDVFIGKQLKKFTELEFSVIMDGSTVSADFSEIDSQLPFQILEPSSDGFKIHLIYSGVVDYDQSLFMIPFVWEEPNILLGEGFSVNKKGETENLAIWNLDAYKAVHQK